jgi:hypothetical protein
VLVVETKETGMYASHLWERLHRSFGPSAARWLPLAVVAAVLVVATAVKVAWPDASVIALLPVLVIAVIATVAAVRAG